ncbi:SRPBCC family protein [Patescibacteria group bacterium]
MKHISLRKTFVIKAPVTEVFKIITDFENIPKNFPKVAKSITITKRDGDYLEADVVVKSFGTIFPVKMKTQIIPQKGFVSDNDSPKFGTSGHEEFLLEEFEGGTKIKYLYELDIHKKWLRIIAKPFLKCFVMKIWEKAVLDEIKKMLENK